MKRNLVSSLWWFHFDKMRVFVLCFVIHNWKCLNIKEHQSESSLLYKPETCVEAGLFLPSRELKHQQIKFHFSEHVKFLRFPYPSRIFHQCLFHHFQCLYLHQFQSCFALILELQESYHSIFTCGATFLGVVLSTAVQICLKRQPSTGLLGTPASSAWHAVEHKWRFF